MKPAGLVAPPDISIFWADQNFCPLVGDCGLQFAAKLGVEGDGALVDVLPVVALGRLHVDHLVAILVGVEEEGAVELGHPLALDLHRHLVPHPVFPLRPLKRLPWLAWLSPWSLCPLKKRGATEANEEVGNTSAAISNNSDIVPGVAVRSCRRCWRQCCHHSCCGWVWCCRRTFQLPVPNSLHLGAFVGQKHTNRAARRGFNNCFAFLNLLPVVALGSPE